MPATQRIDALAGLIGRTVAVRGWVMTTRSSGKIAFVVLRDGTGYLQAVLSKKEVPAAAWGTVGALTQETSVEVTGTVGEHAGTLFATDYFDLGKAYLAQTGQLYVEAAAAALGKVYCFGPTFRAEKSKTRRHLTEFWMVEPEVAWNDCNDNMTLQEEFVAYVVARCLERRKAELAELQRDTAPLARVVAPFPRVSYTEAVERLEGLGAEMAWGRDLGGDEETLLAKQFDRPVMVYNYPRGVKAFYMKENQADPRTVLNNDMLAPEGYGEIIGGSQREDDYDRLLARIREEGLPEEAYAWYLHLRKCGTVVHAGFGLGIERTVAWICGIPHIREALAFPRTLYKLWP